MTYPAKPDKCVRAASVRSSGAMGCMDGAIGTSSAIACPAGAGGMMDSKG
jgi:hypothetical protein